MPVEMEDAENSQVWQAGLEMGQVREWLGGVSGILNEFRVRVTVMMRKPEELDGTFRI